MITYTFSRREKVLILILAVILLFIAWFMLIYQNTSAEMARLESEIAAVSTTTDVERARVDQMQQMQSEIEARKSEGVEPVSVPDYDNLQPLMAELNGILGATDTYTLSFDQVDESAGEYVNRGVRIEFGCASYAAAENIVNALADGTFPCVVDSVAIVDNDSSGSRSSTGVARATGSPYSASLHVTFFERA